MTTFVSLTSDLAWQKFPFTKMSNDRAKQTTKKPAQNVRKYLNIPAYILLHIFFLLK